MKLWTWTTCYSRKTFRSQSIKNSSFQRHSNWIRIYSISVFAHHHQSFWVNNWKEIARCCPALLTTAQVRRAPAHEEETKYFETGNLVICWKGEFNSAIIRLIICDFLCHSFHFQHLIWHYFSASATLHYVILTQSRITDQNERFFLKGETEKRIVFCNRERQKKVKAEIRNFRVLSFEISTWPWELPLKNLEKWRWRSFSRLISQFGKWINGFA